MKGRDKLRSCIVYNDIEGWFHGWSQESQIVPPSLLKGGHSGGVISAVMAIVELKDGAVCKVDPDHIKFTDITSSEVSAYDPADMRGRRNNEQIHTDQHSP